MVLGIKDAADLDEPELPSEAMPLNMGPSHPAMHGTVRMVLEVEGEKITSADVQVGYLHRCFEKEAENATYTQIFPYTDRLNYVSPMLNNVGFALAVERLLGIDKKVPERAQFIRVIVGEISRITDHLTCLGAGAMELGSFTPFLYNLKLREWFWELLEEISGARLTHSYLRIGGVSGDMPEGWGDKLLDVIERGRGVLGEVDKLLPRNRIFRDRMDGIGIITKEDVPQPTASPARWPGPRAWPTTSARTTPTWSTTASTSTSPSDRWATTSIASRSGWKRCTSRCASSSRRWPRSPTGRC